MPSTNPARRPAPGAGSSGIGRFLPRRGETSLFPILICAYGVYYLSDTWGANFETTGYGLLCCALAFGFAGVILVRGSRAHLKTQTAAPGAVWLRVPALAILAMLVTYSLLQQWFGFIPATFAFCLAGLSFMDGQRPSRNIISAIAITAVSWALLIEVLNVPFAPWPWD